MTADTLSRVFAALADPTRRDMVARLSASDATVNQLAEPYRSEARAAIARVAAAPKLSSDTSEIVSRALATA